MPYAIVLITQADIVDGHYWQIADTLSTHLPACHCEDNVLRISRDDADVIVSNSSIVEESLAETLSDEISDEFVAVLLIQGQEKELSEAILKTAVAVYGERTVIQLSDDDYWKHLGGAITHTTNEEHVWAWASVLLPKEPHYYPHKYR